MAQFYTPAKKRPSATQSAETEILSLDYQGQGVARWQGKTLFVSGALPGERVIARIYEDKRQYAKAHCQKILQPSAQRQTPPCPHYRQCGGCQMQHVDYALQVASKQQALQRMMSRETGLAELRVNGGVIEGPQYGYRRRARLSVRVDKKTRQLQLGFRQAGSDNIVDIHTCPVLQPELSALLPALRECLSNLQALRAIGHIELVAADNGILLVVRHTQALPESDKQALLALAQVRQLNLFSAPDSEQLTCWYGQWPLYRIDGLNLHFSPRDFIQVNPNVNQQMVAQALAWLELDAQDRLLDLFCGMGNFTLPAAKLAADVVGVEGVEAMVEQARRNAADNALANVRFYACNLDEPLTQQSWAQEGFNKVLLDPARAGALAVMPHIVNLQPERIVYVSCNPATLARDSKVLIEAGYQLVQLGMLDMFPHTAHLESMALFVRTGKKRPPASVKNTFAQ
ncbi:MAG: 23S rRNA (uracil(1939)-C(5))-methyltransferase RlmD [Plesiomonas shigelloides]